MAFICRICKSKFLLATSPVLEEVDVSIVSTLCGHLFHRKCLEASLTNQKLSHAMVGTGPFRPFCPALSCGYEIPENGIVEICTVYPRNLDQDEDETPDEDNSMELKLIKKCQYLSTEKDKLEENLEKVGRERESYREALDEIKTECEDLKSLLVDDSMIKKGDRVFWVTKDGTLAPGRVLEMRKKSGVGNSNDSPYAVIKLERKTKIPGQGPYKAERETAMVSVNELLTFKSFFKEFFEEFRHKLWKILLETNEGMTIEARQKLLRSRFRESSLRLSFDSSSGIKHSSEFFSTSHEAVDCLPIEQVSIDCGKIENQEISIKKHNTKIRRAATVSLGTMRPKLRSIGEVSRKSRAKSWQKASSPLSEASEYDSSFNGSVVDNSESVVGSPLSIGYGTVYNNDVIDTNAEADTSDFIAVGERVIWYDTYSETPLVGEVASLLQYTPCAIVKFDKLPTEERQVYQYRTVPIDQLFPYALSSLDEKLRLAEAYCTIQEFMEAHPEIFQDDEDEEEDDDHEDNTDADNTAIIDDEEYFTTGSSTDEDIIATVHDV